MSDSDHIHQAPLQDSGANLSEAPSHTQNEHNNPIISIQSSQEFQNIDTSQSQDISASFNTLVESQNQERLVKEQSAHQKHEQSHQEEATQQVQPESNEEQKPQKNQQPQPQQHVDYQSIVSLKIFQKKINQSLEFKNQGNEFFKVNQYQQAIQKYSEGLRVLDPQQFYGATQAQCQKMAEVSASLLFNIGSCFFNINQWRQAQIYFNETIVINPNHIKALYKRALCRYELQNYEEAMADIKLAFSKDKSNVEIHKSYEKILQKYNQEVKRSAESMKQISSKIFRKESQNSVALSQKDQNKEEEKKQIKQNGEEESGLWGFAPLILVAGAALFFGYKKFFGK